VASVCGSGTFETGDRDRPQAHRQRNRAGCALNQTLGPYFL